jgi:hypothetical protein
LMPDLRIIVFTVHAEELRTSLPSKFGIDAVVAKSDGIGKVVECVRTLLPVKPMERRRTERLMLRIGLRVSVLNSTAPMQTTESLNLTSAGIYFVTDWPLVRSTPSSAPPQDATGGHSHARNQLGLYGSRGSHRACQLPKRLDGGRGPVRLLRSRKLKQSGHTRCLNSPISYVKAASLDCTASILA